MSNVGKGNHAHWTPTEESMFIDIVNKTASDVKSTPSMAVRALKKAFPKRTVPGLRSRMERLFKQRRLQRDGAFHGSVYALLKRESYKLHPKKRKPKSEGVTTLGATTRLYLPAAEVADIAGYRYHSSITRLARQGKVASRMIDGKPYYSVDDAKKHAKRAKHLIGVPKNVSGFPQRGTQKKPDAPDAFVDRLAKINAWASSSADLGVMSAERAAEIIRAVETLTALVQ